MRFIASGLEGLETVRSKDKFTAELQLANSLGQFHKILFLLTNLPYWLCFYDLLWLDDLFEEATLTEHSLHIYHMCGTTGAYAVSIFAVALASTVMHSAQLRIFSCCSCSHRHLHRRTTQSLLKKLDVGCALWMILFFSLCQGFMNVFPVAVFTLPWFIAGAILKRTGDFHTYTIVHGIWHVSSALGGWYLLDSERKFK